MNPLPYIERGGEQVYAHPFIASRVQFFGFVVEADQGRLQAEVCDRFLNHAFGRRRFVPLLGRLMLVFDRIQAMVARDPPDDVKGVYTEQEAAAWVPVLDTDERKLYWHHPYMLVDNAYALAMGREIYGFPKMLGWIDGITDGPARPGTMEARTTVTTQFGSGQPATPKMLLKVQEVPRKTVVSDLTFSTLPHLTAEVLKRLGIDAAAMPEGSWNQADLLASLQQMDMPMIFLKQFRDGVRPAQACFQSIQTCHTVMTRLHDLRLFGAAYELVIDDHQSHPFRTDLGLPAGAVPVDSAFWGLFDFEVGVCRELWKA